MFKIKSVIVLMMALLVAGIVIGCSGGAEEAGDAEPAAVEETAEPAAEEAAEPAVEAPAEEPAEEPAEAAVEAPTEEPAEEPAEAAKEEPAGGGNTLEALCNKLVEESKAMGTPEAALEQTKSGCLAGANAYEGNADAMEAFVGHIMIACEGKSGMEWFQCYTDEGQAAAQHAGGMMQ